MWDYNNDGVIDYQDEADYWDDIYFEEHRDEYTPGLFSQSRYTPPKKEEKVEEIDQFIKRMESENVVGQPQTRAAGPSYIRAEERAHGATNKELQAPQEHPDLSGPEGSWVFLGG